MQELVKITHIEMTDRAQFTPARGDLSQVELIQSVLPCPELNRFLYASVGAAWRWYMRLGWTYQEWMDYLERPELETWIAYVSGTPAGYFELEKQSENTVEVAHFGLMPNFIGKGLGGPLLNATIERAWCLDAKRVWLHTCSLDHPRALPNYLARGFQVFKIEEVMEEVPDGPLDPWPGAGLNTRGIAP